jgi:dTDP-4-amino-4,6-dideoxygalactose transaminase
MATATATVVPYFDLKAEYAALRDDTLAALDRVCRNASFILGEEVELFEKQFAEYCDVKHCVALNSGTSALHLGLLALGVQPGDEVITTPNTFVATAEAITYCGARPVFADVDPATGNIDPGRVARAITRATKAILPVHLYGRPADMDALMEIAARHKVSVLEDAAQAHGARYRGRRAGSLAQAAAFSFYPSKNLGAYGEGGALTTNDDRIAEFARAARNHGQSARYEHEFVGYNYRMEGFQGAVLQIKLKHLEEGNARRRQLAATYRQLLADVRVDLPLDDSRDECAYHLFVISVKERDCVRRLLADRGIETMIHYPRPLHLQPAYATLGIPEGSLPHAERACERVLSLPLFPGLQIEQVELVVAALREIAGRK